MRLKDKSNACCWWYFVILPLYVLYYVCTALGQAPKKKKKQNTGWSNKNVDYTLQLIYLHLCTWQMLFSKNDYHYIEGIHFVMHFYGNQSHDLGIASTMLYFMSYKNAFITAKYIKNWKLTIIYIYIYYFNLLEYCTIPQSPILTPVHFVWQSVCYLCGAWSSSYVEHSLLSFFNIRSIVL